MQQFSVGTKLIFGRGALDFLASLGTKRPMLVADPFFVKSGLAQRIMEKTGQPDGLVFSKVQPDPSASLVAEGAAMAKSTAPDLLLALGGGSAMDLAKGILMVLEQRPCFAAIPTTSGTGSEVTSFSILTSGGTKHAVVDAALRPDYAILEPSLLQELPPGLIAESGMDAVSHCIEAAAAKDASPVTDALASGSLEILLRDLPRSFMGDTAVRENVHLAATMAGLAFDNAGLGLCHAMAHALGGALHLPHGRLGGILLPSVIGFNAGADPAPYARLARRCGCGGAAETLCCRALVKAITTLRRQLQLPATLREAGAEPDDVRQAETCIVEAALADRCLGTNPRAVTAEDVRHILREVTA